MANNTIFKGANPFAKVPTDALKNTQSLEVTTTQTNGVPTICQDKGLGADARMHGIYTKKGAATTRKPGDLGSMQGGADRPEGATW